MFLECYNSGIKEEIVPFVFDNVICRLKRVDVSDDKGNISQSTQFVHESITDFTSQFTSSDFTISSIMAVGATHMLKPVMMQDMSNMDVADKFENYKIEES